MLQFLYEMGLDRLGDIARAVKLDLCDLLHHSIRLELMLFYSKDALGGGQTVYIDQNGITQWTFGSE